MNAPERTPEEVATSEAKTKFDQWDGGVLGPRFSWADIDRIAEEHPTLRYYGYNSPRPTKINYRHPQDGDQPDDVNRAADILRCMTPISTSSRRATGSYTMKHTVEGLLGRIGYISNGQLITAALLVGVEVKPVGGDNPNAVIGVPYTEEDFLRRRRPSSIYGANKRETPPRWSEFVEYLETLGFPIVPQPPTMPYRRF